MDITQDGIIITIVTTTTQVLKPMLPKKFIPAITWAFGGALGGVIAGITTGDIINGVIRGLLAGAASNGVYSQAKRLKKTNNQ